MPGSQGDGVLQVMCIVYLGETHTGLISVGTGRSIYICMFARLLQIVTVQQHYVKPSHDYSDNVLSEECKQLTGLNEEHVKNAQPLELVLDEVRLVVS